MESIIQTSLTVVAISDTHTLHDKVKIPDGDILIHAGDFTDVGALSDTKEFNEFLANQPHSYKIVIAGNHDFCFEKTPEKAQKLLTNCIYLQDKSIEIEGIKFYGSPWQPWFYNWAFNLQRGKEIRAKWELIPKDTDVLITHGPAYGHGDQTTSKQHVGCEDLLEFIEEIKPKYHIFGHIHEGAGISSNEYTTFVNACSCTFSYKPTNPPVVFTLTKQ